METTLAKGLQVLEAVARAARPCGVSEVARATGLTRSNAHRLLRTLSDLHYLSHDTENGRYGVAPPLLELGFLAAQSLDARAVAHPIMVELARATGENVVMSILDNGDVLSVDRVESSAPVRSYIRIGQRTPSHCTSPGKALLAFADERQVSAAAAKLVRFTERTIATREDLQAELARVRRAGHAISRGEWRDGVNGIAAPIRNRADHVRAALSVSGPAERFKPARIKALLPLLMAAVAEIGAQIVEGR